MRHVLKDVGPRDLYFNLKGLLFLSNQGSQLAPQMLKHIIRPHRTRMCGSGAATGFLWCSASINCKHVTCMLTPFNTRGTRAG